MPSRDSIPDPESAAPVPIPDPEGAPVSVGEGGERDARRAGERAALERARRGTAEEAGGLARALTLVLPGAGHMLSGALLRGFWLLFGWLSLLALALVTRRRLAATFSEGSLEDWVALATLVAVLAVIWLWAFRDLMRMGKPREEGGDSQWSIASRRLRGNGLAMAGLGLVVVFYLMALLAPLLAPFDPIAQNDIATTGYLPPGGPYWLGTDQFGRDVLSRILFGARISLAIGFIATAISITLGTMLGALAGYFGGKVDAAIMRFTDMVLAFPRLVLLILIVALFSPGIAVIIVVLGLTQWPSTTRIVRGDVLSLREREFVQAARSLGLGRRRIILRHIIPNVIAPVIVTATLGIGNTIVLEAGLSFLGLGVQPPTPSWGNMVAAGRDNLLNAWWVTTFPGLIIVLVVLAFNLFGDGLRDALDPRLRS